jgi:hypothetical protein
MDAIRQRVNFTGTLAQFFEHLRTDRQFEPASREWMRNRYYEIGRTVDSRIGQFFSTLPRSRLEIREVEAFRERNEAGGSYQTGTPDGSRPGVFYGSARGLRHTPCTRTLTVLPSTRCAADPDPPPVQQCHPVRDGRGLVEVVQHDADRHIVVDGEVADEVQDLDLVAQVEEGRRLVEQQHPGVLREARRPVRSSTLPPTGRSPPDDLGQPNLIDSSVKRGGPAPH